MVTKRTFLKQAAVATAAAAVVPIRAIASSGESMVLRPMVDVVVFNERYADARLFASTLSEYAGAVLPMDGDVGLLWYQKLRAQISARACRVAGMGTHTDLLVLQTLARDAGLRVRYRGEHDCRGALTLTHRMAAGAGSPQLASVMAAAGCSWPAELARALSEDAGDRWTNENPLLACTNAQRSDDHPGLLVSWVLA